MPDASDSIIAIVGNVSTHPDAPAAAEALGRELAKAGFRILVYSSGEGFLEGPIVRGYVGSKVAARRSVEVRYPLHEINRRSPNSKPALRYSTGGPTAVRIGPCRSINR